MCEVNTPRRFRNDHFAVCGEGGGTIEALGIRHAPEHSGQTEHPSDSALHALMSYWHAGQRPMALYRVFHFEFQRWARIGGTMTKYAKPPKAIATINLVKAFVDESKTTD